MDFPIIAKEDDFGGLDKKDRLCNRRAKNGWEFKGICT